MNRSQKSTQQSQSNAEVSEAMVNEVVKTLLVLDAPKKPIKKSDIFSDLSTKPSRKQMPELLTKVGERLEVLGMALSEVNLSKTISAYILTAKEPDLDFMYKYLNKKERAERTLLILVLAYIFMKDGVVTEDELFRHLSNLKIIETSAVHEYFGDVKKKITEEFVEQAYLVRKKEPGQDIAELRWGKRANLEVPKMAILEFVCKIGYGDRMQPRHFASHYGKVTTEEDAESD